MAEMLVEGIGFDENDNPVVILQDKAKSTTLLIWIEVPEAWAIQIKLENRITPRPLTHDLIVNTVKACGAEISGAWIYKYEGCTFFAKVVISDSMGIYGIESRPSDAIALALRSNVEIYVNDDILKSLGVPYNTESRSGPNEPCTAWENQRFIRLIQGDMSDQPD